MTDLSEKPKLTLASLLTAMQMFDEGLLVEFDPSQIVGDLKDKIDAVKTVIDRLEFQAEWARQQADPFMRDAYSAEKNAKRLKEYVAFHMQRGGFQDLPGNTWRAQLQNSPPSLEVTQPECTADDVENYPNYARHISAFEWDTQAIKDALISKRKDLLSDADAAGVDISDAREFKAEEIPFAKLTIGAHARFYIKPPEGAKKGRK